MAKKDPTTAAELNELTVPQLAKLAEKRGVPVARGDGEEGEPLKEDYVKALSAGGRRPIVQHKFVDAQGHPVNENAERVDKYGDVIEDAPGAE